MPSPSEWSPHAEKEFARFTHALGRSLPAKLTASRRNARRLRALTATTRRKVKG